MPELPEVETVRLQLNKVLSGLKIADVEVRTSKIFHGNKNDLIELNVDKVERVGKMILVKLKDSKIQRFKEKRKNILLVHLKMTGRLIFDKEEYEKDKHTHIIITFTNGKKLYFWDQRKFGWMKIMQNLKIKNQNYKEKFKIGVDSLTREFTQKYFASILKKSRKPIKVFLMEQDKIAGVGNIYANEALFSARIHPKRPASSLNAKEAKKLYDCLKKVLQKGLRFKGASDNSFRLIDGTKGKMQNHFLVYKQNGKPCSNCGEKIKRIKLGGRGTFYCEKCQK